MSDTYLEPHGIVVPPSSFQLPRAMALVDAVSVRGLPYVQFVECRQFALGSGGTAESVVFDVEVERPQRLLNDIHRFERISVTFVPPDDSYPEVLALRDDFPRVTHTNVRPTEFPRSLCLYDQPWPQVAMRWTAAGFIERIRLWLAETAKGTLHQGDQPLEPLLFGSGYRIILPADFFDGASTQSFEELKVSLATDKENCRVLFAEKGNGAQGLPFLALSFIAEPQKHGVIRHAPQSLRELDEFVKQAGIPLVDRLYEKLGDWNKDELKDKKVLIVVAFPLTRDGRDSIESTDLWVFMTMSSVAEIGVAIGLWDKVGDYGFGRPLVRDLAADGRTIPLDILSPQFDLSRATAASASGFTSDVRRSVAVGAGALGSQLIRVLAQSGFGTWCVIDEDTMLPHNVARHSLKRNSVGVPKAAAVAFELRQFYAEEGPLKWYEADVLRPGEHKEKIAEEFAAAELVLDLAASVPVSRYIANEVEGAGRRIAAFLNPRGTDLILLVEDAARAIRLDCLEMQYYRAISGTTGLEHHLAAPEGRLRYARSCRDISSTLPNHFVAMHAAIGAKAIRQVVQSDNAAIRIWVSDPETLEIRHISVPVSTVQRSQLGEWTLVVDDQLTARIAELRAGKLPNETGGVLIGSYDLTRQILYVVDTIASPPDSEEWPTLYIRGKRGLAPQVDLVRERTDGQLEYVGEWHSHPDGCPCLPSENDLKVFGWLTTNMNDAGLPALMAIAGQGGICAWFLGQMLPTGGWETGM